MNIKTTDELDFAIKIRRIISLGGSPTDLQLLFPDYFDGNRLNAGAKAARVYKDLKPKTGVLTRRKVVSFHSLMRTRQLIAITSDFSKLVMPLIQSTSKHIDLVDVLLDVYEAWLDSFEKKGTLTPELSFQQANAIFRYLVNNKSSLNPLVFVKCGSCGKSHPNFSSVEHKSICLCCPYCQHSSLEYK